MVVRMHSPKVLHAGDGYTYLTREVAHGDTYRERGATLEDYYTAQGTPPGRWMGSGLSALGVSGRVSEEQMRALFGAGLHPDAYARVADKRTTIIGSQAWRQATTKALEEVAEGRGVKVADPTPTDRAEALQGAREGAELVFTVVEHRAPESNQELDAWVEKMDDLNAKQDTWRAAVDAAVTKATGSGSKPSAAQVKKIKEEVAGRLYPELEGHPPAYPEAVAGWIEVMDAPKMSTAQAEATAKRWVRQEQLGRAFPDFTNTAERQETWLAESRQAVAEAAAEQGVRPDELDPAVKDQVLTETATRVFEQYEHRLPKGREELSSWVENTEAKLRQPVAGYDLVFTPPKSFSVLWALGGEDMRRAVQDAHHAAVESAMELLEAEVAFTRTGAGGIAQVDTKGIVAAAFDHYDSRSGDPNLHTHFVVSNKIQGEDGRWRSLDGRVAHSAFVTLGTHYDAMVKAELAARVPEVAYEARYTARGKRPVWEVAGIPRELCEEFSSRDRTITERFDELLAEYRAEYGRTPSKAVQHKLAKQATIETRPRKTEPESLADKVSGWLARAPQHLDGELDVPEALASRVAAAARERAAEVEADPVERSAAEASRDPEKIAAAVVDVVSSERSEWKVWHLRSQAARQVEAADGLTPDEARALVDEVTARAVAASISLEPPETYTPVPDLSRASGENIYTVHGQTQYSSATVLDAEARLLTAAETPVSRLVEPEAFEAWAAENTTGLSADQRELVQRFATSDRLLEVASGAAGSGKSTAMAKLVDVLREHGTSVRASTPSAAAAEELGEKLNAEAETIDKLLWDARHGRSDLRRGEVLLVDEASMASTRNLDALTSLCAEQGAVLRLLGDPYQLDAVEQGGMFRTLVEHTHAPELTSLFRFKDREEAKQTLAMRKGDPSCVDWYLRNGRVHSGTREAMVEAIYRDWRADMATGVTTLMMFRDNETVSTLNQRARADRVADGEVEAGGVELHDGSRAGVGDVIVTRKNDRRLRAGWRHVKNGHLWHVAERRDDGSLVVAHAKTGAMTTLPSWYVQESVELGYASTIHRAQGSTVWMGRSLGDATTSRAELYVQLTRAQKANHLYLANEATVDVDLHHAAERDQSERAMFEDILRRDTSARSAHDTLRENYQRAESLEQIVGEWEDVRTRKAALTDEVGTVLKQAGFSEAQQADLRTSTAWHTLSDRILRLADRGANAAEVVRTAAEDTALAEAEDPAATLAENLPGGSGSALADLVSGEQVREAEPGTLEGALAERAEHAARRADALADRALAVEEPWLDELGDRPATVAKAADRWDSAVRYVAAYRERYGIAEPAALGEEPDDSRQRDDYLHGVTMIEQAQPTRSQERLMDIQQQIEATNAQLDQSAVQTRQAERTAQRTEQYSEERTAEHTVEQGGENAAQDEAQQAAQRQAEEQQRQEQERLAEQQRLLEEQQRGMDGPQLGL